VAAGFQADKKISFVAELAQTPFKVGETFRAGDDFEGLEQHITTTIDGNGAVKALSDVDTNEDVDKIVGGGGGFSSASHTCG
jgi:hypothetical protein